MDRPTADWLDVTDSAFVADPYPAYRRLREAGPLVWHEELQMWLVAGYANANAMLRNPMVDRVFRDRLPESEWATFNWLNSSAALDAPRVDHVRMRRAMAGWFARGSITSLSPLIERVCNELLDEMAVRSGQGEEVDLVGHYAEPLPIRVISELLGVPQELRADVRAWSVAMVALFEVDRGSDQELAGRIATNALAERFAELTAERRARPTGDLISAMVEKGPDTLSDREVVANAVLLFNGGTGAVINALGTGLLQLLSRPKSRELYCSDPQRLGESAVEEFLRFDAPLQLFERTALEGLEFQGLRIQQGERIGLLLGAANRDPAEFMEPDSFDIRRDPNPHLTFSAGAHFCLGAPLARREMQIALPLLFTRFPELRISSDPVPEHGFVVRGYARIPVTVD